MVINNRLKQVADLVPKNSIILDCGCDHAYLTIYLVKNKIVKKAYASDIEDGPISIAKKNILKENLEKVITLYKADGLESINPDVNTLIISGMGTSTILNILKNGDLSPIENLIISSNNDYYELRKQITNFGYFILKEEIILDRGKYYQTILFKKGHIKYTEIEYKYGPILIREKTTIFKQYLDFLKDKNQKILDKINSTNKSEIKKIKKVIKEISSL